MFFNTLKDNFEEKTTRCTSVLGLSVMNEKILLHNCFMFVIVNRGRLKIDIVDIVNRTVPVSSSLS